MKGKCLGKISHVPVNDLFKEFIKLWTHADALNLLKQGDVCINNVHFGKRKRLDSVLNFLKFKREGIELQSSTITTGNLGRKKIKHFPYLWGIFS